MKKLIKHIYSVGPQWVSKAEFWLATTVYVITLLVLAADHAVIVEDVRSVFAVRTFLMDTLRVTTLYVTYVAINFFVVPSLIRREQVLRNIAIAVAAFFLIALAFGELDFGFIPFTFMAMYTAIRYTTILIWKKSSDIQARYRFMSPGVLVAVVFWIVSMILLIGAGAETAITAAWGVLIPMGIFLYTISFYYLIPKAFKRPQPLLWYLSRVALILVVSTLPLAIGIYALTGDDDAPMLIAIANPIFQLAVIVPFSWELYRRFNKDREEVVTLQKELGQSVASADFLRSQINPHFLFNALNTLYGTAINEKAERTAEGVQKLGDMMRFMLDENMQDTIPLSREIEYLNNYIALQKLRTDLSPTIRVETSIEEVAGGSIAPMLLIPFVENAFKHGISFREPSHIRVTLAFKENQLFFDVYNSKHPKPANDPEADRNGIGLQNVQDRLKLLYPLKHELIIRETATEFFVHLTIHLSLSGNKV